MSLVFGSVCSGIEAASCQRCKLTKPASDFSRKKSGRQAWCKSCYNAYKRDHRKRTESPKMKRAQNLRARYGIEPEDFDRIFSEQNGLCAICRNVPADPVLDHDHVTGAARGILCRGCNIKLAPVEDSAFRNAALAYLDKHG